MDPHFVVVSMSMPSHELNIDNGYYEDFPMRRKPSRLTASIELQLEGSGNFTEYLNEDKTLNKDKLEMAIFKGTVKLVFWESQ